MQRKLIAPVSITCFVFLFLWYWIVKESNKKQELKSYPERYAYYIHSSGSLSWALASEDKDCMDRIKEYYENLDRGVESYVPKCAKYSIQPHEVVHLLSDEDSLCVKIACFYISPNGNEKHFIGYVLKSNLHTTPAKQ